MPEHPHILAIEVSNPSSGTRDGSGPGVAIGRLIPGGGVQLLAVEPVRASGFGARAGTAGLPSFGGHDDDLMPAIDRVFRRAGVSARDGLSLIAVSAGPGGYTSLRVACAVGKMIAAAAGSAERPCMCVRVPTAMVILESVPREIRAGFVAVALAGKADSAWIECFAGGEPRGEGGLFTAADVPALFERGIRTLVADRFLPEPMRSAFIAAGVSIIEPVFDAGACAAVGARLPPISPTALTPIYPREPDAVTLWRARAPRP